MWPLLYLDLVIFYVETKFCHLKPWVCKGFIFVQLKIVLEFWWNMFLKLLEIHWALRLWTLGTVVTAYIKDTTSRVFNLYVILMVVQSLWVEWFNMQHASSFYREQENLAVHIWPMNQSERNKHPDEYLTNNVTFIRHVRLFSSVQYGRRALGHSRGRYMQEIQPEIFCDEQRNSWSRMSWVETSP